MITRKSIGRILGGAQLTDSEQAGKDIIQFYPLLFQIPTSNECPTITAILSSYGGSRTFNLLVFRY